eukprot:CAMPEP_0170856684 /NCGR_PEP_ID=MMETSP0734-20130129/14744_1 /TAXON_ID=186038 /ORGANISM="Fragilariopsis kerguelensis, Strain L26-C5" /LENGTH=67 /DNA_ID=CAMNT_0011228579 /DNA_START=82 /DNA_END=281 /DNA_ORIENTATION=-
MTSSITTVYSNAATPIDIAMSSTTITTATATTTISFTTTVSSNAATPIAIITNASPSRQRLRPPPSP